MPKIRKKRCWSACPGSRYALRIAKQKYKQKATYHILRSYPTRQGHRTQNNDPTRNTIVLQAPCAEPGVACLADEPCRYQQGSSSGAVACTAAMCAALPALVCTRASCSAGGTPVDSQSVGAAGRRVRVTSGRKAGAAEAAYAKQYDDGSARSVVRVNRRVAAGGALPHQRAWRKGSPTLPISEVHRALFLHQNPQGWIRASLCARGQDRRRQRTLARPRSARRLYVEYAIAQDPWGWWEEVRGCGPKASIQPQSVSGRPTNNRSSRCAPWDSSFRGPYGTDRAQGARAVWGTSRTKTSKLPHTSAASTPRKRRCTTHNMHHRASYARGCDVTNECLWGGRLGRRSTDGCSLARTV